MSQILVTGEAKVRDIQGPVVANSGVITALDGDASQYVRGDGTLADFPTSTGGGSSVSYYLNSSVSQGTIGGVAYRQLSKTPISGAGTDITASTNGYIASYITDANDPALLEVPAGNFNCEFYFSVNSNNHNPYVYAELYKYDGTTFTLLGSNVAIPEYLTNGTTLSAYYFAIPVAVAALTITDRLAIRIYANVDGRVVTLHTENNHLCQVVTTFSKGLTSLNNLTRQVQFLGTGTSGTDFNIVSSVATHTFNIPDASAISRGFITNGVQTIAGNKTFSGQNTFEDINKYNLGILMSQSGGGSTSTGYTSFSAYGTNGVLIGTITQSNILTFNSTALRTYTFPDLSGTLALLEGTQTFTGTVNVLGSLGTKFGISIEKGNTPSPLSLNDIFIYASSGATNIINFANSSYRTSFSFPTSNQTFTFPAATGTLALTSQLTSGTVTSVGLSSATSGVTIGSSPITTSGTITLAIATASGSQNGLLSSTDWTTFNNKYNLPTFSNGSILFIKFSTIAENNPKFFWNDTNSYLGIGTNVPTAGVTSFSSTPATQFKAAGVAPAMTFSNTLTAATYAAVFGLATSNNDFVSGTATGDFAIANQSTSAGAIVFGTGTTEKMRMTSAGTFSIGNTNSTYNLDVTGTGRFTSTLILGGALSGTSATFSGNVGLGVTPNASTDPILESRYGLFMGRDETNLLQNAYFNTTWKYAQTGFANRLYLNGYNGGHEFYTAVSGSAGGTITWGTPKLTIASTGAATFSSSVTAGTGSKISGTIATGAGLFQLQDSGRTASTAQNYMTFADSASTRMAIFGAAGDGNIYLQTDNSRNIILNGGNVGIGTSSPTPISTFTTLEIRGATGGGIKMGETGLAQLNIHQDGADAYLNNTANGSMYFYTNDNPRMQITSGGEVLMNTSSTLTAGWLCIAVASNNYNAIVLKDTGTSYSSGNYYQVFTNSSNTISGTISHPTATTVSFNTSSDYRLKEDFKDFIGLDILSNIKFYDFKWKDEDKRMHGVIAHELEPLLPLAVSGIKDAIDEDGKIVSQGVDYSKLVPILGKAIQELEARIKQLENK
jgi:hypothetical protein